jgi:hypothetical protein
MAEPAEKLPPLRTAGFCPPERDATSPVPLTSAREQSSHTHSTTYTGLRSTHAAAVTYHTSHSKKKTHQAI